MRITAIEKPTTFMLRMAHYFSKRKIGKVITPIKVICARVPASIGLYRQIGVVTESGFTIEPSLRILIATHVASINRCGFCVDISRAQAVNSPALMEKLSALEQYKVDDRFSKAERAALDYCTEVTETKAASDETFARLRQYFNDTEIVEITMMNAIENFYNLQNGPLQIESDGLCVIPQSAPRSAVA